MALIATVGYENTVIDDFVDALVGHGIEQVLDIRELPLSRKKGFSKTALADALSQAGIAYIHIKPLGDPRPGRMAAREGRWAEFRKIFGQHMKSDAAQAALDQTAKLARAKRSVLLCFERIHTNCHRDIVADALRLAYGFKVEHLEAISDGDPVSRRGRCSCEGRTASRRQAR